jgi:hypothetical protein
VTGITGEANVLEKPHADAAEVPVGSGGGAQPKPGGKVRLLSLGDLDRRTVVFREVRELVDAIERDLGGADRLSSARRQVIEAGALATAMRRDLGVRWLAGEKVDPAVYATLCNTERRQYEPAGAYEFAPRDVTPTLEEYARQQYGQARR